MTKDADYTTTPSTDGDAPELAPPTDGLIILAGEFGMELPIEGDDGDPSPEWLSSLPACQAAEDGDGGDSGSGGVPTLIPGLVPLNSYAPTLVLAHLLRAYIKAGGALESTLVVCNAKSQGCYQQAVEDGELPRGVTLLSNGATGPRSWRGEAADLRLALQALGSRATSVLVARGSLVITRTELLAAMMTACRQEGRSVAAFTELEPHMSRSGQVLVLMRKPASAGACRAIISTASHTEAEVGDDMLVDLVVFHHSHLQLVTLSGASSIEGMVEAAVRGGASVGALPLGAGYYATRTLPELLVTREAFQVPPPAGALLALEVDSGQHLHGEAVAEHDSGEALAAPGPAGSARRVRWSAAEVESEAKAELGNDQEGEDVRDEHFLGFERDVPGRHTVVFSKHEEARMQRYEGIQYFNPNSKTYRTWLAFQNKHGNPVRDQWVVTLLVGLLGGLTAWALAMCFHSVGHYRVHLDDTIVQSGDMLKAWAVGVGFSFGLMLVATALVMMVAPAAAGAGIAEVVAYLNGVQVPGFFGGKVFVVKARPNLLSTDAAPHFLSCSAAVASGAPVGPEGPIIHMGAILGSFLSQGQSAALKCSSNLFTTLRNSRDRRDFITLGVAVGVAAAFKAPVGGLLFTYEEMASHWNVSLTWKIFVGCVVAVLCRLMLDGWVHYWYDSAGQSDTATATSPYAEMSVWVRFAFETDLVSIAIMMLGTCVIGVLCGCLAVPFTFINTRMARWRAVLFGGKGRWVPWARMAEPLAVIIVWTTIALFVPMLFPATPTVCHIPGSGHGRLVCPPGMTPEQEDSLALSLRWPGNCSQLIAEGATPWPAYLPLISGEVVPESNHSSADAAHDGSGHRRTLLASAGHGDGHSGEEELVPYCFSDLATLLRLEGTIAFEMLLSRGTSGFFSVPALLITFALMYVFAALMAGSAIATGLFIPMMYIGGIVGRLIGISMRQLAVQAAGEAALLSTTSSWIHVDPGVFCAIGAAAYVSGVTRLTLSIAVIMSEITGTAEYMLLMVVAISLAKFIADYATHPLYHTLIEIKCMPLLPQLPVRRSNALDLVPITQLMHSPPVVIQEEESFPRLHDVLDTTSHNCFPVVRRSPMGSVLIGTMLRSQLQKLLARAEQVAPQSQSDLASYQSMVDSTTGMVNYRDIDNQDKFRRASVRPSSSAAQAGPAAGGSITKTAPALLRQSLQAGVRSLGSLARSFVPKAPKSDVDVYFQAAGQADSMEGESLAYKNRGKINLKPHVHTSAFLVSETASVWRCYNMFLTLALRHVVVVDRHHIPVGIVSRKDLVPFKLSAVLRAASAAAAPAGAASDTLAQQRRMLGSASMEMMSP
eukprot:jgi/Tetstr1/456979/TSEL_043644.t1